MKTCVVIGCGRIFEKHAVALQSVKNTICVIAVVDPVLERSTKASEIFKCKKFSSIEEFCSEGQADLAVILTPSGLHAQNIYDIKNNVKTVLVEKPVCLSLDDMECLERLSETALEIYVVKQNRYNSPIAELRDWIDTAVSTPLIYGTVRLRWCRDSHYYSQDSWRGTWLLDGGVLTNQASHHIDILQMFMGEVEEVYGVASYSEPSIETETTAIVTIKFSNGAIGLIEATTAIRPQNLEAGLTLVFENCVAEIGGHALNKWVIKPPMLEKEFFAADDPDPSNVGDVYGNGHLLVYEDLIRHFQNRSNNLVSLTEGLKTVRLLHAIYESIETNNPVRINAKHNNSKLGKTRK